MYCCSVQKLCPWKFPHKNSNNSTVFWNLLKAKLLKTVGPVSRHWYFFFFYLDRELVRKHPAKWPYENIGCGVINYKLELMIRMCGWRSLKQWPIKLVPSKTGCGSSVVEQLLCNSEVVSSSPIHAMATLNPRH